MLKHPAHLAVLALAQRQRDPRVAALLALETRTNRAIDDARDRDALFESGEAIRIDLAMHPHLVAPQPSRRRQFEAARERTVVGQQQQSLGIEIEAAHRNHPWQLLGQRVEDGRPALLIAMRGDEPGRLVIAPQARPIRRGQRRAVDPDIVRRGDRHCRGGQHVTIDRNPPGDDPALGVTPRAQPSARQQFGDALRCRRCLAHPPATSTKARKIRRSASLISNSGCHWTPRQKRRRGSSMPSTTPSSATALTRRLGPASLTAWWWALLTARLAVPVMRCSSVPGTTRTVCPGSSRGFGWRCATLPGTSSGMCWIKVPPSTTFRSCWPPQIPSTGIPLASAPFVAVYSKAVRRSFVVTLGWRLVAPNRAWWERKPAPVTTSPSIRSRWAAAASGSCGSRIGSPPAWQTALQ